MEAGGWVMMILSVGTLTMLFGWCLWRVLFRSPAHPAEYLHGGLDIDTQDTRDT